MRFVRSSVVIAILLLALPFVFAAEDDACAILSGGDYECIPQEACGGCADFSDWCTNQNGDLVDSVTDHRCVDVCCCDGDASYFDDPEPMNRSA